MSRHNFRRLSLLKLLVPVAALAAILTAISCVGLGDNDDVDERFYGYFLRDTKAMQDVGLPVYWLGREFTVDGVVFRGPYVSEFGAEVEGGGIRMSYVLVGGNTPAYLTIYSRDAWELVKDRMMNPRSPGTTHTSVSLLGRNADVFAAPGGARPLNAIWLVLDLSDVVVVADTNSGGAIYPGGPDYNPFINNPDLLVQVMEDLRPYPE